MKFHEIRAEHFYQWVLIFTALIIIPHFYNDFFQQRTVDERIFLFLKSLTILIFGWALLIFQRKYLTGRYNYYPQLFITTGILFFLLTLWNFSYVEYIKSTSYEADIFRFTYRNFWSPVYGFRLLLPTPRMNWILAIFIVYTCTTIAFKKYIGKSLFLPIHIIVLFLLAYFFDAHQNTKYLWPHETHYQTFAEGLPHFTDISDLLKNYTKSMHLLGNHNNHYPPGNLLILMIFKNEPLSAAKYIVMLITSLTLIPIYLTAKTMYRKPGTAIILSVTALPLIIFPNNAMAPITAFWMAWLVFFLVKYLHHSKIFNAVCFGILVAVFTFFSFSSSIAVLFVVIFLGALLFHQKISLKNISSLAGIGLAVFIVIYLVIYFISGFNVLTTFVKAIEHNEAQTSSFFDNGWRYLLRSTGNILAFAFVAGIHLIIFLKKSLYSGNSFITAIATALVATIIISGFSGLFYLETERIWIFLIPVMAVAAGYELSKEQFPVIITVILLQMVIATLALQWLWYV